MTLFKKFLEHCQLQPSRKLLEAMEDYEEADLAGFNDNIDPVEDPDQNFLGLVDSDSGAPEKYISQADATAPFKELVPPSAVAHAKQIWEAKAKTFDGQKEILHAAQTGDWDATVYLYYRFLSLTCWLYWRYFVGPHHLPEKIWDEETTRQLALSSLQLLHNQPGYESSKTTPFKTFNLEKYDSKRTKDLLNNFGYWYGQYFNGACQHYAHKWKGKDMSFEAYTDSFKQRKATSVTQQDLDAISYSEDPITGMTCKDIILGFQRFLQQKEPIYLKVFKDQCEGLTPPQSAKNLGISNDEVHRMRANITRWLIQQYPGVKETLQNSN